MSDINVYTSETGDLAVATPYDRGFISGAHKLRGRWDSSSRAWLFDHCNQEAVEELLREVFGYVPNLSGEVATVRISLDYRNAGVKVLRFAGEEICRRPTRDYVSLAINVEVVEGKFPRRGGSIRFPRLIDDDSVVVLQVADVPVEALENETSIAWEKVE